MHAMNALKCRTLDATMPLKKKRYVGYLRNDVCLSQVTMILLVTTPYLTEEIIYTTALYYILEE